MSLEFKKISPLFLGANELKYYQKFILTSALFFLKNPSQTDSYWMAFEARQEDCLVGLALLKMDVKNSTVQLYSLCVEESSRQQGIGLALFRHFQTDLVQQHDVKIIGFEYLSETPYAEAMEKILIHQKWPVPFLDVVRYYFIADQFYPFWFHSSPLPSTMHFFNWEDLTSQDNEQMKALASQNCFYPYLNPLLVSEYPLDYSTSVGLRYEGQLIGWSLTHFVEPDSIRYSNLFVMEKFKSLGLGIQLLIESLHRHRIKQERFPYAFFEVRPSFTSPSWQHFIEKRLVPHASRIVKFKWAMKRFFDYLHKSSIK